MPPKLLSVHVAKAGGTSFGQALRAAFGDRLALDYGDDPANPMSPRNLDPARHLSARTPWPDAADCIHGHFHPAKYEIPSAAYVFTLLREPVQNIISIHYFWKSAPGSMGPLGDYAKKHCDSVVETAQLPILQRLYSETYFGGFDMKRFDRIGRHAQRNEVVKEVAAAVGVAIPEPPQVNVTATTEERTQVQQDASIAAKLRDLLTEDLRFYDRWAR